MGDSELPAFRCLLLWLKKMLTQEDVEEVRLLLGADQLGPGYDTINGDARKLLEVLERGNHIHERDIELLQMCFKELERDDILKALDEYKREQQVDMWKLQYSSVDGPFFGHTDILDQIVGILEETYDHVHMVCIAGMAGTGKTRLAKEACLRLRQKQKVIFVDLRELKTVEAIFFAIMHGFGVECRSYEPEIMYSCFRSYVPRQHGGAVLVLDSADDPLDPNATYDEFVTMVENITNLPNKRLKLLITSRFGVEKLTVKKNVMDCWRLDGDNELDMGSAREMVRYHAGKTHLEDNEAEEFVRICRKIPLALKVVASRLQDQTIKPAELLRYLSVESGDREHGLHITKALSHLGLPLSEQIVPCLTNSIKSLPDVHRRNLVKLAVIPGLFTIKAACMIIGYKRKRKVELQLQLQALKYRSFLDSKQETESDQSHFTKKSSTRYSMHLLLRSFVQQLAEESEGEMLKFFKEAEMKFVEYFSERMKRIADKLHVNAVVALGHLQDDSANFLKALQLIKTSKEYHKPDKIYWLNIIVEMLLVTKDRLKFYQERAECGCMQVYAESKCYQVYQLMEQGYKADVLLPMLQEAEDELEKLDKDKVGVQLSLATCYQFCGDVYLRDSNCKKAIPQLEKCLAIRKKHLGDHYLTGRAYNSLGSAYQDKTVNCPKRAYIMREKEKGIDCFNKALDICRKTTKHDGQHLEEPTFLMNLGTCLHDMDKYEEAVKCYQDALKQEKKLGMDDTDKTCTSLKNIAMSYYEMEKYDKAIPIAKKAMDGRKHLLGTHHLTARSIYFVGSLNLVSKNYKEARKYLDEALVMEEELWRKGQGHSVDWPRLKKKIVQLLTTLWKDKLATYKRRFRKADNPSNQHKPKLESPDDGSESDSSSSESLPLKRNRASHSSTDSEECGVSVTPRRSSKKRRKKRRVSNDETDSTISSCSGTCTSIQMGANDIEVLHFPQQTPLDDDEPLSLMDKLVGLVRCVIL